MLISLVEHLDKNCYRSLVCLLKDGWLRSQLQRRDIQTVVVPQYWSLDFTWLFCLARILKNQSIDVMHAHEFAMNVYGSLLSLVTGIPIVATVHGKNYYWKKWRRRLAYRFVARQASMVAVSEDLKRFLTDRVGISPARIRIVHNGIDTLDYEMRESRANSRKALGINATQPVVGTVGNLYPVKGHAQLIKAFSAVVKSFSDAILLIAGRGEELSSLREECTRLGIPDNVKFLGFREDIPVLLQAMDVFVLPSVSEGLPLSILEAMTFQKPIVASLVGGIPEVVTDGKTGFLVPPGNPEALADKILVLLGNPQLSAEFGEMGRQRVLATFSLEQMIEEYQALYERAS